MLTEEHCVQLLESHNVKPTANRIVVARALAAAMRPLLLAELEAEIGTIDKSGIFRTLTVFKENHLVHLVEDGCQGVRYELCHSRHEDEDDDMHVHFHCTQCHKTFCIDNTPVPVVELPDGYLMSTVNYVVKGICPDCAKQR
jgi:Fur family ferric uptake transcriptional regulator